MKANVEMLGNCAMVRIPKAIVEELGLTDKHQLELDISDGELCVRPFERSNAYSLDDLVRKIIPDNRHSLVDFVGQCGAEF